MSTKFKTALKLLRKTVIESFEDVELYSLDPSLSENRSRVPLVNGDEVGSIVVTKIEENEQKKYKRSSSNYASKRRKTQLLRKNQSTGDNESVLQFAVAEEDLELTVQTLSNSDIDINAMRPPGITVLHQACVLGNVDLMRVLIEAGADKQQKNFEGLSPLHLCACHGNFDAAMFLIDLGVSTKEIRNGFQLDGKHELTTVHLPPYPRLWKDDSRCSKMAKSKRIPYT